MYEHFEGPQLVIIHGIWHVQLAEELAQNFLVLLYIL
jgi:hypothetical protein